MILLHCKSCGFVRRLSLDGCACSCEARTSGFLDGDYRPVVNGHLSTLIEIDDLELIRALYERKPGQREPFQAWVLSPVAEMCGGKKKCS
jgi:hypothetical protein